MGNKLDATRIALDKGFTGVSDPTSTLSAISKGMKDVASWKKGIDDAEIKLKTDTAKAYQDSKKLASERMTGNKTVDAAILEALRSTQERLYDNVKMVEKGMQSPTDNLIFRQNASTSYDTLSSYLKDYDANFQQSLKEAQGYTDANGNYVKPTAGAFQSAIQKFQTTLGNPNLYKILSSEDGSLNMNLYKTKINTKTNTRELDLDNDGNPIIDPTMSGIGASTILKGKNQKSPRVYMNDSINEALDKDTALSKAFEVIKTSAGYTGIVVDDARNNRNIERLINAGTGAATATVEQRMSILMDNMPPGKEQIPVMPNEVAGLKADGVDLKEQISYEYIDPSTGEMLQGKYNKYVTATLDPMSTLFMGEETDEAKIASIRIFKSGIYSGLQRKITGRDKTTTFRPNESGDKSEDYQSTVDLVDLAATGDVSSLNALVDENPKFVSSYDITGKKDNMILVFIDPDGNRMAPIPLTGLGVDVGKQIAAKLQLKAQKYLDKSKLKGTDKKAKGKVSSYKSITKKYGGLGAFNLGVSEKNGIKRAGTAAEVFATAVENNPDEDEVTGIANTIIQKAIKEYDIDSNIQVSHSDESGPNDRYVITVDSVDYKSPAQSSSENHTWLQKNMDIVLRGGKPSGTVSGGEKPSGTVSGGVDYENK
tara:strand:+ start:18146 stop:20107 length:1962 start_codon:yes stop_codon:yes gene_type:complete